MSSEALLTTSAKKQNALLKLEECMRNLEGARLTDREQYENNTEVAATQEIPAASVADTETPVSEVPKTRGKPEQPTDIEQKAKANTDMEASSKGLY